MWEGGGSFDPFGLWGGGCWLPTIVQPPHQPPHAGGMMKLLWHSNSPWSPTGYGNQTGLFAPRLAKRYDLKVSSFYGLEGAPMLHDGVQVLPGLGGTYGNEALPAHVHRFFGNPRDGLVVTLLDVWVLETQMCSQLDMACWVPVDHEPAPPRVTSFFQASQAIPIAMSRFGQRQLAEFDPLYVPHGVDTKQLKPVDRQQAREQLGLDPDAFVVGMVAANKGNPSRKSFSTVLAAFAEFRRKHENAKLYLHTDIEGLWSHGVPLAPLIETLQIPADAIAFPDPYAIHFHPLSTRSMSIVYSAMDVLLNPAMGEGFGIPVLEAQSCGTPAIVSDFSAMPEVCGAGWTVKGQRVWTAQSSWQFLPDTADVLDALESCYGLSAERRAGLSRAAREHARAYDVDRVLTEFMLPAFSEAQERLQARRPMVLKAAA